MLVVLLRVFGHGDSLVPNSATILSYRQKDGEVTFIESGAIVRIVQWDSFFKPRRDSQPRNRQAEKVLCVTWDLVDAECVISKSTLGKIVPRTFGTLEQQPLLPSNKLRKRI